MCCIVDPRRQALGSLVVQETGDLDPLIHREEHSEMGGKRHPAAVGKK